MNRDIIRYQILVYPNASDLEYEVCQFVNMGWQPFGPPIFNGGWAQAVVKYGPEKL